MTRVVLEPKAVRDVVRISVLKTQQRGRGWTSLWVTGPVYFTLAFKQDLILIVVYDFIPLFPSPVTIIEML